MSNTSYNIKLPQFEGPFDLLLFFIERDELDIHDIPIAKITNDFLGYIQQMEQMNIDLASEFILVAATLCRIKAKIIIPRKPVDDEGNEIDPRHELIQRLIEYKRYKSVLDELQAMEESRAKKFSRGNVTRELRSIATKALVDAELESLTLFKLLKTFERLMQKMEDAKPGVIHKVYTFTFTIEEQRAHILSKVAGGRQARFKEVFGLCENRIHAIITFLALLELLNMQRVQITQGEGMNNFWLSEGAAESDIETPLTAAGDQEE